jgi:hypothetical protein
MSDSTPSTTATASRPAVLKQSSKRSGGRPGLKPNLLGGPLRAVLLPIALLACFCLLDRINSNPHLMEAFGGAVVALLIFFVVLSRQVARAGRTLTFEFVPRPVHYVQFVMHTSVYIYWGWYWREVYHDVSLIAAQIVFAYALDMLVCWARRDSWVFGFGPIPIVMSTNLFLWFKDDWFYLQFLLIATGVLGKEFIRWKREGRLTHIFNPSAFSLCLFSIALILTHNTDISWGVNIATTFQRPPNIYLEIFLLGLVVQALFRVTLVTLSAAAALYGLGLWYTGMTGDYQFIDSNIPVAVFLGLHLLTTDPATSPRRDLGKIIFGALYGASVFGAYSVLKLIGAPEFYDKLLVVPALNLSVQALDRFSGFVAARFASLSSALTKSPRLVNYAWMGVWAGLFVTMTASGFLVKGKDHPGSKPAFWAHLCQQGRSGACTTWTNILRDRCQANSTSDCLTLGKVLNEGRLVPRDAPQAGVALGRACDSGAKQACSSLIAFMQRGGSTALATACDGGDGAGCFILGSMFSSGSGLPSNPAVAFELFQKSCDVGWSRGCGRLGVSYLVGQGTLVNPSLAIANFEKGCQGKNAASCLQAAQFYQTDKWGLKIEALAHQRLQEACDLGLQSACQTEGHAPAPSASQ